MEQKETRVLRFFAEDQQARQKAIEELVQAGKVDAQVWEKNEETLLLLTSQVESGSAGKILLDRCCELEQQACGDALYGTEDKTLFAALIEAMQQKNMLFVAADTEVCQLLNEPLSRVEKAGSVYDFGACSCDHAKNGAKISKAGSPALPLAAAQDRIRTACRLTGADWAVACYAEENCITLVVGNENGCWIYALREGQRPVLWIADMLRRAALGCQQAAGVLWIQANETARETTANTPRTQRGYAVRVLSASLLAVVVIAVASWFLTGFFSDMPGSNAWAMYRYDKSAVLQRSLK